MLISSPAYLTLTLLILPFLSAYPICKREECESSPFLKPRNPHPDDDPSDPTSWNANYGPWGDPGYKEHYGGGSSNTPPPPVVVISAPAPAPAPPPPPPPPPSPPQAPPNTGIIGWFTPSGPSSNPGGKHDPLVCTEMPKTINGKGFCSVDGKPTVCEGMWRKPTLRDLWVCMPF
ncbi:hypothetical protein IFR05_000107 [Cadophora sp. M221]|nr:hypothetical protein IFR05_000107 [Cadophora sp. M221]